MRQIESPYPPKRLEIGLEEFNMETKSSQQNTESLDTLSGDPTGNRTPVSGVRGQRPNR